MWRELFVTILDALASTATGCGALLPYDGCGWSDEMCRPAAGPRQDAAIRKDVRQLRLATGSCVSNYPFS